MPHDIDSFPYVVVGDGVVASRNIRQLLLLGFKTQRPTPVYFFAHSDIQAREIADIMKPHNETVMICKIVEVAK